MFEVRWQRGLQWFAFLFPKFENDRGGVAL